MWEAVGSTGKRSRLYVRKLRSQYRLDNQLVPLGSQFLGFSLHSGSHFYICETKGVNKLTSEVTSFTPTHTEKRIELRAF